jgi:hypothetical protein
VTLRVALGSSDAAVASHYLPVRLVLNDFEWVVGSIAINAGWVLLILSRGSRILPVG